MLNILLVEDNEINQLVTVKMLQRWGIVTTVANNGKEALDLIESKSFQLVLMDLNMPVMDGYESTVRIRRKDDSYFKTVPILAFTASEIVDAKETAVQSGMNDIISKPIQKEEFQSLLDQYVLVKPLERV